jgi:GNAT superfamily N-acetyltransferase
MTAEPATGMTDDDRGWLWRKALTAVGFSLMAFTAAVVVWIWASKIASIPLFLFGLLFLMIPIGFVRGLRKARAFRDLTARGVTFETVAPGSEDHELLLERQQLADRVSAMTQHMLPQVAGMVEFRPARIDDPEAISLIEAVQAEYVQRYGGPDASPMDADDFTAPHGAFLLGVFQDTALAMGGWRRRTVVPALGAAEVAEIKRMYVVPDLRRQGLARRLLASVEESARRAGHTVMVLNTGAMQPEAIALYESSGYERLAIGWGTYACAPDALFFAKRLA